MTANAFMSVSLRPPLVLISVDRSAKLNALPPGGRDFGVSVLEEGQRLLSDRFAGRPRADDADPRFEIVRTRRWSRLRSPSSWPGCCGAHGAAITRSSSDRSDTSATARGHLCCSTAAGYERVVRDPHVVRGASRGAAGGRSSRPAPSASYDAGESIMRIGAPGDSLSLVLEGTVRVERPGSSCGSASGSCSARSRCSTAARASPTSRAETTVRCLEITRLGPARRARADPRAAMAPDRSPRRPLPRDRVSTSRSNTA